MLRLFLIVFTLHLSTTALLQAENQFHLELSPEERVHYFGTDAIQEIPAYEYTMPERIDQKRKRSIDSRGDDQTYIINAFGETTHIVLEKNRNLLTPGCIVQHYKKNNTRDVYPCDAQDMDCYFTGSSLNHSDSWVAASVCGGMDAMIGLPNKTLVVQPIRSRHIKRARRDTSLSDPHIVYEYKPRHQTYGSDDYTEGNSMPVQKVVRKRRAAATRFVETTAVLDPTVYKFHGGAAEKMTKTILNIVATRFQDPSLGTKVYFTLNKVIILEQEEDGLVIVEDATETLNNFCHWQAGWNPASDSNPEHSDYVTLISKVDFAQHGDKSVAGLARKGMCRASTQCSIVEDNGLATAFTMAHETGHVLGLNHDSDGNSCPNGKHIMASVAASGPESLKWSSCSAHSLGQYLSSSEARCLDDSPPATMSRISHLVKPGSLYTANHQCKLMMGPDAEVCGEVVASHVEDVCGSIVCRAHPSTQTNTCTVFSSVRMDGTDCGHRKWCIDGICVPMGAGSPGPVHGGWSQWSGYGECSRSCGGGVRIRRRKCNDPEPMYGGRTCPGDDVIAVLCNMPDCRTSQPAFLAEQCAATDHTPLHGEMLHWVPYDGALGDSSCQLTCKAQDSNKLHSRGLNVDGSECVVEVRTPYARCVQGRCRMFGCDGHADSGHKYDHCAICNGQGNTCKKLTGAFQGGRAKELYMFKRIPKGSTQIIINQKNVYCWLSVKVGNEELFTPGTARRSGTYRKGGVLIKYNKAPERIEILGPTSADVDAKVYRQYDDTYSTVRANVTYEYSVPLHSVHAPVYMWKTHAGTCSKSCGTGKQNPVVTCVNSNGAIVGDFHCQLDEKPGEHSHPCNTHACAPRWRSSNWGQCSKSCDGGQQHRSVECVQENNNVETVLAEHRCRGQTKPRTSTACNSQECPGAWKPGAWSSCSETCARGIKTREVKCYANANSNTPIEDSNCITKDRPRTQEYCIVKPCNTDITGAACKDSVQNCFRSYGDAVCTGAYKPWAHKHCMKSCGVCSSDPPGPVCKDKIDGCSKYQAGFCTNSRYMGWARNNCQKYCGYCPGQATTTTTTTTTPRPVMTADCADKKDNCAAYTKSACVDYAPWAHDNCRKFCNFCQVLTTTPDPNLCVDTAQCAALGSAICEKTQFAQSRCRKYCGLCKACDDQVDNCAAYGANMCKQTAYKPWAKAHCQKFCGYCGARRKRDVSDMEEPPLINEIYVEPPIPRDVLENDMYDVTDVVTLNDVTTSTVEQIDQMVSPSALLCNTVRTTPGTIDVNGKLSKGEECEQVIVLTRDSRVELTFDRRNIDCDAGDVLYIMDGITQHEHSICDVPSENSWISSGNIAALYFKPGVEGHGYQVSFKDLPQNKTIGECTEFYTSAVGTIRSSERVASADDACAVYITGTPGAGVQIEFDEFHMVSKDGRKDCIKVEDLDGGEVDEFCGELSPFLWGSRGPRVRLVYHLTTGSERFTAVYKVHDLK